MRFGRNRVRSRGVCFGWAPRVILGRKFMNRVTRRNALTGAAAVTAAGALPSGLVSQVAPAAAPLAGKQNSGWYRYKVGDFEITVVTDGVNFGPLSDRYVLNVPKDDVSAGLAAMHYAPDKTSNWYNPIVVNTSSKLVVIDAGGGPPPYQHTKGTLGHIHNNLAASVIDKNAAHLLLTST